MLAFLGLAKKTGDLALGVIQGFVQNLHRSRPELAQKGVAGAAEDGRDAAQRFADFVTWQKPVLPL